MIGTLDGVTEGVEMIDLMVGKNHSGVSVDLFDNYPERKIVVRILILERRGRHSWLSDVWNNGMCTVLYMI